MVTGLFVPVRPESGRLLWWGGRASKKPGGARMPSASGGLPRRPNRSANGLTLFDPEPGQGAAVDPSQVLGQEGQDPGTHLARGILDCGKSLRQASGVLDARLRTGLGSQPLELPVVGRVRDVLGDP